MAHELNFTNGQADTFSVKQTPWHGEGIVLPGAPSFDEALVLAKLDYEVEKVPAFAQVIDAAGAVSYAESGVGFLTRRKDTGKVLGQVGLDYHVVQNSEAFEVLKPLVDQGLGTIETGGVLRNGADAWLMIKWATEQLGPQSQELFGKLGLLPYAFVAANHNGRRGLLLKDSIVRIVCANTLHGAESDRSKQAVIKHTKGANEALVASALALWGGLIERFEKVAEHYRLLTQTILDRAAVERLVIEAIAPDPRKGKKFNPDAKMAELVVTRWETKRDAILGAWTGGAGHSGDHSAYEAYNGAVEVLDHRTDLFPTRAGTFRTASLLTGQLGLAKDRVLSNLLRYATVGALSGEEVDALPWEEN